VEDPKEEVKMEVVQQVEEKSTSDFYLAAKVEEIASSMVSLKEIA
jgi:hypothetical protein